jgi:TRAP-type C4-dicarboxylate transport system permease small subunit
MQKFTQGIDRITNVFAAIAGVFMLLGVALVIIEVIVRSVFDSTIYITSEYTAYFMVALTFFGIAYTLKEKAHIRMTFLQKVLKGDKPRFFLGLYSFLVGFVIFAVITVVTFNFFWDSVITGTRSIQLTKTYLAIPQFALPLGSFVACLQFASEFIKTILNFRKGEFVVEESESQALGR